MKKWILASFCLFLTACAPSDERIKKVIQENPDLVFQAIKSNPEGFIETVNEAAQIARVESQKKEQIAQQKRMEDEFKNPKTFELQSWRAIRGKKEAPITIVEYSDFQCPFCKRGHNSLKEVQKKYGDQVRIVFKHLPLDFHPAADPAARIFEAINLQNPKKAYLWHDVVFDQQSKLKSKNNGVDWMLSEAKKLGLDIAKIKKDMKSEKVRARIQKDIDEASQLGFRGTPGYLINGVSMPGYAPAKEFAKIIDRHLKK